MDMGQDLMLAFNKAIVERVMGADEYASGLPAR